MKKLQCLFGLDAKTASEPGAVGRETILDQGAANTQAFAQGIDVAAKVGEIAGNRQIPLGTNITTRRLALCLLEPENLGQRHRLIVAGVVEDTENNRVVARFAQADRSRRTGRLVALGLVMAEHVGAQRTLPGICPCSLVVGDALRRHEQGRNGIDKG